MNAEEARQVDAVLRRWGLPGVVAPVDPENPSGAWRVYDRADPERRTDTTADTLVSLARALGSDATPGAAQPERNGPTRGFVVPSKDG